MEKILSRAFFERDTPVVAKDLLGKKLVRRISNLVISGIIIETEAYDGEQDLACHAHVGRTHRNEVMYGPAGHAYIYFTYGMHWLLNCVTGKQDYPAAVLLRAILPVDGIEVIRKNRKGRPESEWCNGPAKICQALQMDGTLNGIDLCAPQSPILIRSGFTINPGDIKITPRVGIDSVPEPWRSMPWRFVIADTTTLI